MLSVSGKYDSVNECTQEVSKLMKLHIQGVWQNARNFIRQIFIGNFIRFVADYC